MRAVLIQPGDSAGTVIEWDGKLETLQEHVGGYVEHVQLSRGPGGGIGMYVHDEGMLIPLPINRLATTLYWGTRATRPGPGERLPYAMHGPAVVVGGPDDEGDDETLTDTDVGWLALLGIPVDGEL